MCTTLGLELTFLEVNALAPLVEIRYRAAHEGHELDPAEAACVVHQVELILRETGRLPAPPLPRKETHERLGGEGLSPWWHSAMPHRDIREGRFDLKVFAADLTQVVEGDAVPEYKDADTFFRGTYLTRGLRETLKGVLRRLAGCSPAWLDAYGLLSAPSVSRASCVCGTAKTLPRKRRSAGRGHVSPPPDVQPPLGQLVEDLDE